MPTTIAFPALARTDRRKAPNDLVVAAAFGLFPIAVLMFAIALFGFDPVIAAAAYMNG